MVLFNFYSNFILVTHDYSCSAVIIAGHYFYFKRNNGDLQHKTIKTTVIQCISGRGALFSVIMLTKSNPSGYISSELRSKLYLVIWWIGHRSTEMTDGGPCGCMESLDFLGQCQPSCKIPLCSVPHGLLLRSRYDSQRHSVPAGTRVKNELFNSDELCALPELCPAPHFL